MVKAKLLTPIGCLLLMAGLVRANAVFSFDDHSGTPDAGSYAAGSTFSFDITLAVTSGGSDPVPNVQSLSYWFETAAVNNSYFTITNRDLSGSPLSDPQSSPSYPVPIIKGGDGFDLGASTPTNTSLPSDASYFVATLTLQIDPSTPAGTYTIFTTTDTSNPDNTNTSTVGGTDLVRHDIPATVYTITVVPEPATLSLFGLGVLASVGVSMLRRRRG